MMRPLKTWHEQVVWLLQNGGPATRYRAAADLLDDPSQVDLERLRQEFVESASVRTWLERLLANTGPVDLHSSRPTAYENAMGKLALLGCRRGMRPLEEALQPFQDWLREQVEELTVSIFDRTLVGTYLAMVGYEDERSVRDLLARRLAVLYGFAQHGSYDIYVDKSSYAGIRKSFRHKPLVNPALNAQLPTIYDVYSLAHLPARWYGDARGAQVDAVIEYVLHPDYQALPDGYGMIKSGKRRYHAMGWSVHLPGYHGFELGAAEARCLVQRLVLMARFPVARRHRWFQESVAHLESFRTERGTYLFPRRYLRERRRGYWVTGAYMGLEENRRKKRAIEVESTFWMLKIQKTVDYGSTRQAAGI